MDGDCHAGVAVGLRQGGHRRTSRAASSRAASSCCRPAARRGARRCRPSGHGHRPLYRISRKCSTGASRRCTRKCTPGYSRGATSLASRRARHARDSRDRPRRRQPLPVSRNRRQSRLHARRSDREHRHRRPGDGAQRSEELDARRRGRRPRGLRDRARRAASAMPTRSRGELRFRLMQRAFSHTAAYDGAIANWLTARDADGAPQRLSAIASIWRQKRAGHCATARTRISRRRSIASPAPPPGTIATYRQLQGKELSFNNVADADAAWECVKAFADPTRASSSSTRIHAASRVAAAPLDAYRKAFATDPIRRSAASSRSTAPSTPRRSKRSPRSSSKC